MFDVRRASRNEPFPAESISDSASNAMSSENEKCHTQAQLQLTQAGVIQAGGSRSGENESPAQGPRGRFQKGKRQRTDAEKAKQRKLCRRYKEEIRELGEKYDYLERARKN